MLKLIVFYRLEKVYKTTIGHFVYKLHPIVFCEFLLVLGSSLNRKEYNATAPNPNFVSGCNKLLNGEQTVFRLCSVLNLTVRFSNKKYRYST